MFYINATRRNEQTNEEEIGSIREVIAENFDKKLFY